MLASVAKTLRFSGPRLLTAVQKGKYKTVGFPKIQQRGFMEAFGIKKVTRPKKEFCKFLTETDLFGPVSTLDGRLLAEQTHEAMSEMGVLAVREFARKLLAEHLSDPTAEGTIAVEPEEGVTGGHVYFHVVAQQLSPELMAAFRASDDLDPLTMAATAFHWFPGSFVTEADSRSSSQPLGRQIDGTPEPDEDAVLADLLAVVPATPEADTVDYELGIGNQVTISSASRAIVDETPIYAWINSTGIRHTFDGRVIFVLFADPLTGRMVLCALGVGAHPMDSVPIVGKLPDRMNVTFGALVFHILHASLVQALEHRVAATKATRLTDADLAAVRKLGVLDLSKLLMVSHLLLEGFGLLSVPTFQQMRLLVGGNTVDIPTATSTTPKVEEVTPGTPEDGTP